MSVPEQVRVSAFFDKVTVLQGKLVIILYEKNKSNTI